MTPEFSRPFSLERLGEAGRIEHLVASQEERAELARRLDLLALDALEAELTLQRRAGGTLLEIEGWFSARVVQRCVVSLEPVPAALREAVSLTFSLVRGGAGEDEVAVDLDAPEPLPEGGLDLGEEVTQLLSLTLDPYPRAPGAELPETEPSPKDNPFAVLKGLKRKSGKSG